MRFEAHPQSTCTKNLVKFGHVVFEICERTDSDAHHNTSESIRGAGDITKPSDVI